MEEAEVEGGEVVEVKGVLGVDDILKAFEIFVEVVDVHIGVLATEAYGGEPYAPLPGRNNRLCICADWYNSVLGDTTVSFFCAVIEEKSVTVPMWSPDLPLASMPIARPNHVMQYAMCRYCGRR